VITTVANELVAEIHDRMPLILALGDYARWLGDEPDPADLMRSFATELLVVLELARPFLPNRLGR
jgi:putative SOS response-associated peptidase YedK